MSGRAQRQRSDGTGEQDLKRLFDAARQTDADTVPAFESLWQASPLRGQRRLSALRLAAAVGLIATLAVGLARWTWNGVPPAPGEIATVAIDWQGPTDFLLEIDGELLSTLPAIGEPPSLPGTDQLAPEE